MVAAKQAHTGHTVKPPAKINWKRVAILAVFFGLISGIIIWRSFAASGTLSLVPQNSQPGLGSTFTVAVTESSGTDAVNAVQADLTFPADKLQVMSFDSTGSDFPTQVIQSSDNTNGTVSIVRATSGGTSVSGPPKQVINITFKAIGLGAAPVTFATTSKIITATSPPTDILAIKNNGSFTIVDNTPPSVPAALASTSQTVNTIALSWSASTDDVGVTKYNVYRNNTLIGSPTVTNYTDTGLTANTAYSYKVEAVDAAGNVSNQTTALPVSTKPDTAAPSVPAGLTLGTKTMTSVAFTWTASTDNVGVVSYQVYRNNTLVASPTTPSYTDNGLIPDTAYNYQVTAKDAAGNVSAKSTTLATSTLPDTVAPSVPTGLASPTHVKTVQLTWNASTDNAGVAGYNIYREDVKIGTSNTPSYTDSTVTQNTTYHYAVSAYDAAGNTSAKSATITVTTPQLGDIDGNNTVDVFDLSILIQNFGKTRAQAGNPNADINGDGIIDVFDLAILITNFGK